MNKIVRKEQFSEKVFLFEIEAPLIAKSRKAGNFVIVRVGKKGERMPLTIAAADIEKGTITLVVQKVGLSSMKLCELQVGYRRNGVTVLHQLLHHARNQRIRKLLQELTVRTQIQCGC